MTEENNNSKNIIRISDKYIIDKDYLLRLENRLGETIRIGVIGKTDFKLLYEALVKCYELWVKKEVAPKEKTGYWILADEQNKEDVENDNYRFICSECQCSDIHAKGAIVPYCWKCGTRMESEE